MNGERNHLSADRVDGGSEFNPIKRRSKRRKCVSTHPCVFLLYRIRFFWFGNKRFIWDEKQKHRGRGNRHGTESEIKTIWV